MKMEENTQEKRPVGNPNIRNLIKTGPKSPEGKLKGMLANPVVSKKLMVSKGCKTLNKVRQCNHCPLRSKTITKKINGKKTEIKTYSSCSGYRKNGKKCIMPIKDYVSKVKFYFDYLTNTDTIELQKMLVMRSLMDAETNREFETMQDGRPKFYTKEYSEQALKYVTELNKMIIGEKHRVEHSGEVVETKKVKTDLTPEQLEKIADIMLDGNTKAIEVDAEVMGEKE